MKCRSEKQEMPASVPGFSQCTVKLSFFSGLEIGSKETSGLITDRSALVALLDQPGRKRGTVASTLDYLRKVADRKGISFYAHTTFGLSTN
jgi:hypothetical protein